MILPLSRGTWTYLGLVFILLFVLFYSFCLFIYFYIKLMPLICRIELFLVSFGQLLFFISSGHSLTPVACIEPSLWCSLQNFLKCKNLEFPKYLSFKIIYEIKVIQRGIDCNCLKIGNVCMLNIS